VVEDGQQALDYLAGNGEFADRTRYPFPEVVFLDLKLPLKSGHEVLKWIRQESGFKSLVIVVLTSSEEPDDVRKAYSLGANSYLVKPPTSQQLLDMAKSFKWYWMEYNRYVPAAAGGL
jgi:CheY-like chemotaxis protein